jgi:hypothetical protein
MLNCFLFFRIRRKGASEDHKCVWFSPSKPTCLIFTLDGKSRHASHVGWLNPQTLRRTKLVHLLVCLWLSETHLGDHFGLHCDEKTLNVHLFVALNSCQIWLGCRWTWIENLITYPKRCFMSTHHLSYMVSWFTLIQELGGRPGVGEGV